MKKEFKIKYVGEKSPTTKDILEALINGNIDDEGMIEVVEIGHEVDIKEQKISEIKRIIEEWGSISMGELESENSPVYATIGKDNFSLIERFNNNDVDVVTYVHETEVDEFSVAYEELDEDTIDEISLILQNYEADMLKTEKRCSD